MFEPTPRIKDRLAKLGANYRFRLHSSTIMQKLPDGTEKIVGHTAEFVCHIIDGQTGNEYASGTGQTEPEALERAVEAAITAPKPMTKAQRADTRLAEAVAAGAAKDDEIASLRARIAELEDNRDAPAPTRRGRRNRTEEPPLTLETGGAGTTNPDDPLDNDPNAG